jgi:hypothetical protein
MDGGMASLEALVEEIVFRPSEEHRRLKSRFLARIADNPLIEPSEASLSDVQRILGSTTVGKHWNQPGFREWFLNTGEYQERMEELFSLALDAARDILLSQDPKSQGARASMIKTMAELAGKLKPRQPQLDSGASSATMAKLVASMDQAQLSVFLNKNGQSVQLDASKGMNATPTEVPSDILLDT